MPTIEIALLATLGTMGLILSAAAFGLGIAAMRQRQRTPEAYETYEKALTSGQDRMDRQSARLDRLEEEYVEAQAEITALRLQVSELERIVASLVAQMTAAGLTPAVPTTVAPVAPRRRRKRTNEAALVDTLVAKFSVDELDELAFDLSIDTGELEGTTKSARARALVEYAQRREMIDQLKRLVEKERP